MNLDIALNRIKAHLALADEQVRKCEQLIYAQRRVIVELACGGHDLTKANKVLLQFQELQGRHGAHRDRLLKELEVLSAVEAI